MTDDAHLANGFSAFFIDKLWSAQAKIAANLSASPAGVPVVQWPARHLYSVPRSCTSLPMWHDERWHAWSNLHPTKARCRTSYQRRWWNCARRRFQPSSVIWPTSPSHLVKFFLPQRALVWWRHCWGRRSTSDWLWCHRYLSAVDQYLSERSSSVGVNCAASVSVTAYFGFPQGSVLRPVLFTCR